MKHLRKFKPRALLDMTLVIAYQVIACEQGAAVPISKYITRYVFMDLIELKKRRKEKLKYELKSDRHPLSQMQVKVGFSPLLDRSNVSEGIYRVCIKNRT